MIKRSLFAFSIVISTMGSAQQILNSDFETWTGTAAKERPDYWNQLNSTLPAPLDAFVPQTCFKTTPGYNGTYCIKLKTVSTFQGPANGIATTGTIDYNNQTVIGGLYYNLRPDSLTGYYKCAPATGDNATVEYTLLNTLGDTIGRGLFATPGTTVSSWTRFSTPIVYSSASAPDTAIALISSSNGFTAVVNSEITVDALQLIFNPASVSENNIQNIEILSSGTGVMINLNNIILDQPYFELFDITGKIIYSSSLQNQRVNSISTEVRNGVYLYKLTTSGSSRTGRLYLTK